jgi:integrase
MFALATRWGMRVDNPARGIELNAETARKRYLSGDELARLVEVLARHPNKQSVNIVRMLLLTGARKGEVFSMRWGDVDLGAGIWTKPGSTTKQKTTHSAPLSASARQLLNDIRADAQVGEFVFPGRDKTGHVTDIKTFWTSICRAAGITNLRPHDLRHSFASELASGGAPLPLIGALLGHSDPNTTQRYAHLYVDPQRAAADKVGDAIAAAAKRQGGERGA